MIAVGMVRDILGITALIAPLLFWAWVFGG